MNCATVGGVKLHHTDSCGGKFCPWIWVIFHSPWFGSGQFRFSLFKFVSGLSGFGSGYILDIGHLGCYPENIGFFFALFSSLLVCVSLG